MPPAPTSHKSLADDKELMNALGQIEKSVWQGRDHAVGRAFGRPMCRASRPGR